MPGAEPGREAFASAALTKKEISVGLSRSGHGRWNLRWQTYGVKTQDPSSQSGGDMLQRHNVRTEGLLLPLLAGDKELEGKVHQLQTAS